MTIVDHLRQLYERPMPSGRSGPIYNAFSYPTKIDAEAIAVFIATHTRPHDTVLDVFGGSGSTGIAARLCDKPSERMLRMAEQLEIEPQWGPRTAIIYELSPIGALLADVMCNPPDPDRFAAAATSVVDATSRLLGWLYDADSADGERGEIRHAIWSEVLLTRCCESRLSLWDAIVSLDPVVLSDEFECPSCGTKVRVNHCDRSLIAEEDPITGNTVTKRERVLARVYGRNGRNTWSRPPTIDDERLAEKASHAELGFVPSSKILWGDLYRSGYHSGIERYHHLYTPRNLRAFSALWAAIDGQPSDLQDALRLWLLSYNATHSTLLTRVVAKRGQTDFVVSGAQSGVLYVSGLPVEKNVFSGVKRKINTFRAAFEQTSTSRSDVRVVCASSTQLDLASKSVDYVFTDPPFGDFIPYAEINQVNEAWLGTLTDSTDEAIISPAQNKGVKEYGDLMGSIFAEVRRVLRDSGSATVVFHSSKPAVWEALGSSFQSNGLRTSLTSVLDKTQISFKQVVSEGGTRGDAVFLLEPTNESITADPLDEQSLAETVNEILKCSDGDPAEQTPRRVYSRYVARCIEMGTSVSLTAADFYRWFNENLQLGELAPQEAS